MDREMMDVVMTARILVALAVIFQLAAVPRLHAVPQQDRAAQQELISDEPVARVGNGLITREEFLMRYELGPGLRRHVKSKTEEAKQLFLVSMIAEKLLAEEAREEGLASSPTLRKALAGVERLLVRDELYRREVREKVKISEAELQHCLDLSRRRLKVILARAATEAEARFLEQRSEAGLQLEGLVTDGDSAGRIALIDTMQVRWGEGNPQVEEVCCSMKVGETSKAVRFDDGFYLFKVVGEEWTPAEGDVHSERWRVERVLRRKKEEERTFRYMASVLRGKQAEVDRPLFRETVDALVRLAQTVPPDDARRADSVFVLSDRLLPDLRRILSRRAEAGPGGVQPDPWDRPFVSFPHARWTLGETLERLVESGFGIALPMERNCRKALDDRLRGLVFQEELAHEGYRNRLESSPQVQAKLRVWADAYLASMLRNRIAGSIRSDSRRVDSGRVDWNRADSILASEEIRLNTDRRIARAADRLGVSIDHRLLASTDVTSLSAMFYQMLGFGGRIFAVPLLTPDIDWLMHCRNKPLELP